MFWDFRKLWMNGIPILRKLLLTCPSLYHTCPKHVPKFLVRIRLKTKPNGLGRSWPKYSLDWFKPDQGPNGSVRTFFQSVPNQTQTRPKPVLTLAQPCPESDSSLKTCLRPFLNRLSETSSIMRPPYMSKSFKETCSNAYPNLSEPELSLIKTRSKPKAT